MSELFRWFSAVLTVAALLGAQNDLQLVASFRPAEARPGDEVDLVLEVRVAAGLHAYGSKETTNLPVALRHKNLQLGGLAPIGAAKVPPGEPKTIFGVRSYPLPSSFTVVQRVVVPADFSGEAAVVSGALDYQLCDDNQCFAPAKRAFTARLPIAAAGEPVAPQTKPGLVLVADEQVAVAARFEPPTARAGETVALVLEVSVAEPYHAYGSRETINLPVDVPAGSLQLDGLERHGAAAVPPGRLVEAFGVATYPLPSKFRVVQQLRVPAATSPRQATVRGVLTYQLCDENSCLEPADAGFAATLTIESGPPRAAEPAPEATSLDEIRPAGDLFSGSLWALLLACIGGGLFALVMPCTYPMIPITFSFFTKQADARGGRVLTLALTYGAGIVLMFALIGALAGVLGGYIVPFAAHWVTNIVIGLVFALFGLSLLGLFTLEPPAFLMRAAGHSSSIGGPIGVLLMGATLVITSFTCTAPVVGALLVPVVTTGEAWKPVLGMAVFGLTMATPFVLLSLLPGRVKALPRSGDWMHSLKVSLGVIELAAALKFFSNAEYAQELMILPRGLFFAIWVVLFAGLAVFLWGLWPRRTTGNGRKVGSLASLAFAGYCLYGALGQPLDFVMTALAPPYPEVTRHDLVVDDYERAAALARRRQKLLLVNLTGFTCNNCRMVERGILPDPAIAPLLAAHFVEARLHMDNEAAIPADKWRRHVELRQQLAGGRVTTPTYLVVHPESGELLVEHVLSGGPGAWLAGYRDFLERALARAGRTLGGR